MRPIGENDRAAIRWRRTSPTISPAKGASGQIGSDAEAVEEPLAEIGREAHAGIDGVERDGLHEDARQEILQILVRRAGERAAEHEGEEQREHDRRHDEIEELLGNVAEFQHRAPPEDKRVGEGGGRRRSRDGFEARGRDASSSLRGLARSAAGLPVRAKKTSSRLGLPSAKSMISMPPAIRASSAAFAVCGRAATMSKSCAPSGLRWTGVPIRVREQCRGLVEMRAGRQQ